MNLKSKAQSLIINLKTYWKKPPKGYDVSYKEFLFFNIGSSSMGLAQPMLIFTAIAVGTPFLSKYFGVNNGAALLLGWVAIVLTLLRAPILSMIIDNHNSKKGKFLPFLSWSLICAVICFGAIPFLPASWIEINVISIPIPDIKWLMITATQVNISLGLLIVFIFVQLATFFHQLYVQAITGVEQTITTVSQERTNIASFKGLIANIPGSIVTSIIPFVALLFFGEKTGGDGIDDVRLYRIFFPICAILAVIAISFMIKEVKERVVIEKKHVAKVRFVDGARELSKNKYFWILQIVAIAVGIRALANVQMIYWACTYGIGGTEGEIAYSISNIVLNNAFIPAMILSPFLVKKIGKKKLIIFSSSLFVVVLGLQTAFATQPYIILVCIFFQNFCNGLQLILPVMASDALDYQQYKTGKRMEGFWQNYGMVILTIGTFATSIIAPLFQSIGGLDFGTTAEIAFQDPAVVDGVFRYTSLLALIGAVMALVPMFFYDLSEVKHKNIIGILKIRASVKNHEDGNVSDVEVVDLFEMTNNCDFEKNDEFNSEYEANKEVIDMILVDYDNAFERIKVQEEVDAQIELEKNTLVEENTLAFTMKKAKAKAEKNGTDFDKEAFIAQFIEGSKYLQDRSVDDLIITLDAHLAEKADVKTSNVDSEVITEDVDASNEVVTEDGEVVNSDDSIEKNSDDDNESIK